MLTARKLFHINGHETTVIVTDDLREHTARCVCDCARAPAIIEATALCAVLALERLRDLVLAEHGRIAMDKAGWKCQNCDRVTALSAHHKVFRSHGRDDTVGNLMALCSMCHALHHTEGTGRAHLHRPEVRGALPNVHRVDIAK
jgi:5-methylcytosine-specific restriction endonuclease McrA